MPIESIRGVDIEFPFEIYNCQKVFMEKVIEALNTKTHAVLESPTGTGKTLSLLCSTLGWLERKKMELLPLEIASANLPKPKASILTPKLPKVIYATRTHSQLKQVVREINKTRYKYLKVAILASRDQLCINEKVKKEEDSFLKSLMCRNLVKSRKCHYYNNFDQDKDLSDDFYRKESNGMVMDIEDLERVASKLGHCPFFRSRQMHEDADLILLPYNYILDPKVRESHRVILNGNILIFDEAHNLESICEESVSAELSTKELVLCQKEANKVLELVTEEEERARVEAENSTLTFDQVEKQKKKQKEKDEKEDDKLTKQDVIILLQKLENLQARIDQIDLKSAGKKFDQLPGKIFEGPEMIKILEEAEIKREMRDAISMIIDKIGVFLTKQTALDATGLSVVRGTHLANFASFISKVFVDTFEGISEFDRPNAILKVHDKNIATRNFILYITMDENGAMNLRYWCFSAGLAMRYIRSRGVHSIILTSGTLSPLDYFVHTMGIPFNGRLENVHVAHKDQVLVGCAKKGYDALWINGSFEKRSCDKYKQRIGQILLETVKVTPQGVIVFFPSYNQLFDMVKSWQKRIDSSPPIWTMLERLKKIFIEPKKKNEIPFLELELNDAITNGKGALLLAVCRGKLSEGIDFKDSHCRCVFIVSIPYPPFHDPRVVLKRRFLDEQKKTNKKGITGEEWYSTEGTRSVNQAIGRVIRHKDDFGVVVLADERYIKMPSQKFPSWIRPNLTAFENADSMMSRIATFFKERSILVENSQKKSQLASIELPTRKRSAITMSYESNPPKRNVDNFEKLYIEENSLNIGESTKFSNINDQDAIETMLGRENSVKRDFLKKPTLTEFNVRLDTKQSNLNVPQTIKKSLKLKANSSVSSYFGDNLTNETSSQSSKIDNLLIVSTNNLRDSKFSKLNQSQATRCRNKSYSHSIELDQNRTITKPRFIPREIGPSAKFPEMINTSTVPSTSYRSYSKPFDSHQNRAITRPNTARFGTGSGTILYVHKPNISLPYANLNSASKISGLKQGQAILSRSKSFSHPSGLK